LKKDIPSTVGMQLSVETSELMKMKLENEVSEKNIEVIKKCLEDKNEHLLFETVMKESN
jgi:diphosphomevalonate decarboxylase